MNHVDRACTTTIPNPAREVIGTAKNLDFFTTRLPYVGPREFRIRHLSLVSTFQHLIHTRYDQRARRNPDLSFQ